MYSLYMCSKFVSVNISADTKNFHCTNPKEKIIETNPLIINNKFLGCRRNDYTQYWKKVASLKYTKTTPKVYLAIISLRVSSVRPNERITVFINSGNS